jgi:hypothetical protein
VVTWDEIPIVFLLLCNKENIIIASVQMRTKISVKIAQTRLKKFAYLGDKCENRPESREKNAKKTLADTESRAQSVAHIFNRANFLQR